MQKKMSIKAFMEESICVPQTKANRKSLSDLYENGHPHFVRQKNAKHVKTKFNFININKCLIIPY